MTTERPSAGWVQYAQAMVSQTSVWDAAKTNDLVQLIRLLDEGTSVNERDPRGYTPLMLAGYAGHLEAVDLLLSRGADPNTTDLFGNSVLMGAAYKGFVKIVQRLLFAGAQPDATNNGGLDARGFALAFGRADVFAVLEQHSSPLTPPLSPPVAVPAPDDLLHAN